jgi:NhaP-type Na+/H+ or K+/H+ antiporter
MSWLHVLNLCGLRGAVATVLALWIPAAGCAPLQGTVFGIGLFTLLVQGTTAERLVRTPGVHQSEPEVG